jgi:hypothetical protein
MIGMALISLQSKQAQTNCATAIQKQNARPKVGHPAKI